VFACLQYAPTYTLPSSRGIAHARGVVSGDPMSSLMVTPSIVVSGPLSSDKSDKSDKWSCRDESGISSAKGGSRKTATGGGFSVLRRTNARHLEEIVATARQRGLTELDICACSLYRRELRIMRYQLHSRRDAGTHTLTRHPPADCRRTRSGRSRTEPIRELSSPRQ
jgi:hypothetical protein